MGWLHGSCDCCEIGATDCDECTQVDIWISISNLIVDGTGCSDEDDKFTIKACTETLCSSFGYNDCYPASQYQVLDYWQWSVGAAVTCNGCTLTFT